MRAKNSPTILGFEERVYFEVVNEPFASSPSEIFFSVLNSHHFFPPNNGNSSILSDESTRWREPSRRETGE